MRRVVLGSSTNGIVVLELDWEWTQRPDGRRLRLIGPVLVGLLGDDGQTLRDTRSLGTADFPDEAGKVGSRRSGGTSAQA